MLSKQAQKANCITFDRRSNQPSYSVGLFGDFGEPPSYKPGSPSQDSSLPGIPLDPLVLENKENVQALSLEIEFPTPEGAFLEGRIILEISANIL